MASSSAENVIVLTDTARKLRSGNRNAPEAWLLETLIENLQLKTGCQLPNNGDVLRFFVYMNRGPMQNDCREAVRKYVIEKVEAFWEMAGIPTMPIRGGSSTSKLEKLVSQYENLRKRKTRKNFPEASKEFLHSLTLLFDIAHDQAINMITLDTCRTKTMIAEDLKFLEDQRSERKMELGAVDNKYCKKVERKIIRVTQHKQRVEKEHKRLDQMRNTESAAPAAAISDDDVQDINECPHTDPDYQSSITFSVKVPLDASERLTLQLPHNPFVSEKISTTADRLNLSHGQSTAFMAAVFAEGGVKLDDATLSVTSTRAARMQVRESVSKEIKSNFVPPKHCTLHWDGKLIPDIKKQNKDRLAILVSGMPKYEEGKLLGVSIISSSTGEEQAKATYNMAEKWQLTDHVRALVFDTTASNSGWRIGACVLLERRLDKKLLMLACRHHVYERILSSVHRELFGVTSGPDNTHFAHFRNNVWKNINREKAFKILQIKDRSLQLRRDTVIKSLKTILVNKLPRDDYRECAELMLLLLGEKPPRGIHWLRPGACHNARWMPSVIYPAKMFAFSAQAGYDSNMVAKLESLCMFNALFYVEKWLSSPAAADAPYNDLKLWHDLHQYSKHDPQVAHVAITALERHYWYLTEECVIFALFSDAVAETDKQQIAQRLLRMEQPKIFTKGMPTFPALNSTSKLLDLIGPNSWFLLCSLGVNTSWLGQPAKSWHLDSGYLEAKDFVQHLKVVNDISERAVQLIQSFATTITNDETQKEYLLQVVEHHRKTVPNFQKSTLQNI
jgi:hypothetical protein